MNVLILGAGNSKEKRIIPTGGEKAFPPDAVRLDIDPLSKPDVLWDLNNLPIPLDSDSFDEIHAYEVLEHFGRQGDADAFFGFFNEIYRMLKPNGMFYASVPMWNSRWAFGDPGHTRVINQGSLVFLDRSQYDEQVGVTPMTDYRRIYHGDFCVTFYAEDDISAYFSLQKRSVS